MKIRKFQEGGAVAPVKAPMGGDPAMEQDPLMQILQIAGEALQTQNCEAAMAVCEGFMMLVTQSDQSQTPPPPTGEPVYRKGGTLLRRQ